MVNKISGAGFGPMYKSNFNQNAGVGSKNLTIKKGMTVDYILAHGSEAQKLLARTFDCISHRFGGENDGVYNSYEADLFNSFEFQLSEQKNEITLTNKVNKNKIIFKFDDVEDMKNIEDLEQGFLGSNQLIQFVRDVSKPYECIECDLKNKTLTFSNQKEGSSRGIDLGMFCKFDKIIFNNCKNMFDINANGFSGEIILNDVQDKLFGISRRTTVYPGNAKVTSNNEVKIQKW